MKSINDALLGITEEEAKKNGYKAYLKNLTNGKCYVIPIGEWCIGRKEDLPLHIPIETLLCVLWCDTNIAVGCHNVKGGAWVFKECATDGIRQLLLLRKPLIHAVDALGHNGRKPLRVHADLSEPRAVFFEQGEVVAIHKKSA